jgi:penicillin amidase
MKLHSRTYKILSILFISILSIALIFSISFYFFLKKEVPMYHGELSLLRLKSRVEVKTDKFGIPHIFANSNEDAFRTLGYVIASERLFQMEMQRRMAYGELSELFGDVTLSSDKLFKTLGIRHSISQMIRNKIAKKEIDTQMLSRAQAFYDGVNQFQSSGNLPIEFKILNIKPRPFSIYDGYTFIGLMSFSFGISTNQEPLLTSLKAKLGKDLVNEMRNESHALNSKGANPVVYNNYRSILTKTISELENGFNLFDGSNGWLLSGKKTINGKNILANDPHITFSHPGVWFEAHIKTPDYESYGHFLSILPFPVLSHNTKFGWGLTMSLVDDMDLFLEKINFSNYTYKFKNQDLELIRRHETIKVKNSKDVNLTIFSTHHGPLLDEFFSENEKKHLSLSWAFLSPENDPLNALYRMGIAKDINEFKFAVSLGVAPGLNILYADKDNIGWWMFGEIRHKSNPDSDFILDGSSGNDELSRALSFDEKPHLENPTSGVIVSANSRPLDLPGDIRGDWQPNDRFSTITKLLESKSKLSIDDVKTIQISNLNNENKLIINKLIPFLNRPINWSGDDGEKILDLLTKWDLVSNEDSLAPTIYYSWSREFTRLVLSDLTDDEFQSFSKTPNSWIFFKRLVLNEKSLWWNKLSRKDVINKSFIKTLEILKKDLGSNYLNWQWGRIHQLELIHPIGKLKPFNLLFNLGPEPIGGAYNEINNLKPSGFSEGFKVKAGPSVRRVIEFGEQVNAFSVLPSGNSGHILSPYYKNQFKMYQMGNFHKDFLTKKELEQAGYDQVYFNTSLKN